MFSLELTKEEAYTLIGAAALGMRGKDPLGGKANIEGAVLSKLIELGQRLPA